MTQSEPRAPRAFFFHERNSIDRDYVGKCTQEKITPGCYDILFTSIDTFVTYDGLIERLHGDCFDTTVQRKKLTLQDYDEVISIAIKNNVRFKIIVSASDPFLRHYINEETLPSWTTAKISVKDYDYKVKINFSRYEPRWNHSKRFIGLKKSLVVKPSFGFNDAFRMCLGQWKTLIVLSGNVLEMRVGDRCVKPVKKYGKLYELPTGKLSYDKYLWGQTWFLPSKIIDPFYDIMEIKGGLKHKYVSAAGECIILDDSRGEEIISLAYNYRMDQTRDRFFHETIVDMYLALVPFRIAVYEFLEILKQFPFMEFATQPFVVKTLEGLFNSVKKVHRQREESLKIIKKQNE